MMLDRFLREIFRLLSHQKVRSPIKNNHGHAIVRLVLIIVWQLM
jgi:hypothetical protein